MKNHLIICTAMTMVAAGLGCDHAKTDRAKSSEQQPVAAKPATKLEAVKTGEESKAASAFQGEWDSGCDSEGFQGEMSQRVMHKIAGSDLITTVQLFSDSACSVVSTTSTTTAKLTVGSVSKAVLGSYEVDIKYATVQVTPRSEASVQSLKSGLSEHADPKCRALGETLKVNTPAEFMPCGPSSQQFTLLQVSDNVLRFGDCEADSEACTTAASRAVAMRMGRGFARQGQQ
jgi:hypothetical protein